MITFEIVACNACHDLFCVRMVSVRDHTFAEYCGDSGFPAGVGDGVGEPCVVLVLLFREDE